jgi:UDP-N-acetylglucosamine--N-acetylmuramyl-(pentapeptide) pyrophosphoryl-undecaprenol N-acetylglucosamine transferase
MKSNELLGKSKVYIVATGSGGHIIPAQSIAREIKANNQQTEIVWCTGNRTIEQQLISSDAKDQVWRFDYEAVPGRTWLRYPRFFLSNFSIFFSAVIHFFYKRKTAAIISTGGLLSIPLCLAAWSVGMPVILVELNAIPGKTIKFLFPFATKIWTVFELPHVVKYQDKIEVIEYPLRQFSTKELPEELFKNLTKPSICIALFGGSQGSEDLNTQFLAWLLKNKERADQLYIFHFYGNDKRIDFKKWYQEHRFHGMVEPWTDTPEMIYKKADIVISRGGSGALHELLYFQKRTFIYPLRSIADDHQYLNAKEMEKKAKSLFSVIEGNSFDVLQLFLEGWNNH